MFVNRLCILKQYTLDNYKITRTPRTLWLDEPHFVSKNKDTADVIFILY